jgi:hypothetical protein
MPTVAGPAFAVLEGAPIAKMMGLQDSKRAVMIPVTVPGPPLAVPEGAPIAKMMGLQFSKRAVPVAIPVAKPIHMAVL